MTDELENGGDEGEVVDPNNHIDLIRGGTPNVVFPGCSNQRDFGPPYAKKIAAEYMRGHFTLGNVLHPAVIPGQAEKLKDAQVGDFIWLLAIPEMTALVGLGLRTEPDPMLSTVHPTNNSINKMEGAEFGLFLYLVYADTGVGAQGAITSGNPSFTSSTASGDYDGFLYLSEAALAERTEDFSYVPKNMTMLIGLKYTTGPNNPVNKLSEMTSRISLAAHVRDCQVPHMT